jgi:hypothetical protein
LGRINWAQLIAAFAATHLLWGGMYLAIAAIVATVPSPIRWSR